MMKKMNTEVQKNGGLSNSSNLSAEKERVEEAMGELKIEGSDTDNGGAVAEADYPYRPGEPDCIHYLRTGTCAYGSRCRFSHPPYSGQDFQNSGELPERDGQPECKYYLKTGTCKYGSTCRYHHPQDRHSLGQVLLNIWGLPMRKDEKPCPYYMRTNTCKFGVMCKFDHPQPSTMGNGLPVMGAAYGSHALSFMPTSGVPYVGEVSEISIPNTNYVTNVSLQVPQTYMPVLLSPSHGWNTYLATMGQPSITNSLGGLASNGQMHRLSTSLSNLPDRTDQPECRDFVNTGSCKYGLDCKYHHPRNKIAPLPSNSLGPLGLPLRPGQAVCSYYGQYGLCKYGPMCKFDHPLAGYLYNHNSGIPSLLYDPSILPYQWNSLTVHSVETPPSKSSKLPDLVKKAEVPKKGQNSTTGKFEDLHINTLPNSSQRSLEVPQDESD
ncbi:hypothetical protein ACH5RR_029344 [Cinchona calisaya]|uniref:C3H1-type domain-containing protein n=1 Tax=Cinchona calisaya TaxID=153742 RepID=A0ABD2YWL2_9GENT